MILVHPGDVQQAAARIATELRSSQPWARASLAHESQYLLDLRLGDLSPSEEAMSEGGAQDRVLVRSPTLLETTSVFAPPSGSASAYRPDPTQVLRRVRDHTHMGDRNAGLGDHVAAVGDPQRAPFALFGLPPEAKVDRLNRLLNAQRFSTSPLDAVVVDVSRTGRSEISEVWERRLAVLAEALDQIEGRRPPIIILAEDIFAARKAAKVLRNHAGALRPRRRPPVETGAYLPDPALFAPATDLKTKLSSVRFQADIKDASLARVRQKLVKLGRGLREAGQSKCADGVSQALSLLRRSASLPIGLEEARLVSDVLFDAEDEVDQAARALFRPKMALAGLASVKGVAAEFGQAADDLVKTIQAKMETWSTDTPVSAKLSAILNDVDWNNPDTLVAVGGRRVTEIYLGSDRAIACECAVIDHGGLREELARARYARLILVGPTPAVLRTLLTAAETPEQVLLLGDAAGSALALAEVEPIGKIDAFGPIAERAKALLVALHRGGADEKLDLAEAEFRIAASVPEGQIDFTQAGEQYRGDVLQVRTLRGYRLAYRPTSDVLLASPGELRPFEKSSAQNLKPGDRLLVLNGEIREPIRRALAGSREALSQLKLYHDHINQVFAATPGTTTADKARYLLAVMKSINPVIGASEIPNITRWLTAGQAAAGPDGVRQPRAARDWSRFQIFMEAAQVPPALSDLFWRAAVVPARSYRSQEGYLFNQRVVQFVRDPEGASLGSSAWAAMPELWQSVLEAVDEVTEVHRIPGARNG